MILSPLSTTLVTATSYGGTRDIQVDLSDYLESGENVSSVTMTVSDDDLIVVSGGTASVQTWSFAVSAYPTRRDAMCSINIEMKGDSGSQDVFTLEQPLQKTIRN